VLARESTTKHHRKGTTMSRLIDDLNTLHDGYVEAVNLAVADGDLNRANRLAAEYDDEAALMVATREGRTDLLPIRRPQHADSGLRALIRRVGHRAA
jgi:GTP cyclohydrolase FolE2